MMSKFPGLSKGVVGMSARQVILSTAVGNTGTLDPEHETCTCD